MTPIPIQVAIDRLCQHTEQSDRDELIEIFATLFPARPLDEARNASESSLRKLLTNRLKAKIGSDLVAWLWNTVFPDGPYVYYNEEEEALCRSEHVNRYERY